MADKEVLEGNRILHLTLKKKWFDMIASGEKKEEYREIKTFWKIRLKAGFTWCLKTFDVVEFKNGYGKRVPTMRLEIEDMYCSLGRKEWGAGDGKYYYAIKLGKLLSIRNYNQTYKQ